MSETQDLKSLIEAQGKGFETFKSTLDELKGKIDVIDQDKISKIEKSIDDAVEAKTAIEKRLDAEQKEREDLELRLSRLGKKGDEGKAELELKDFNNRLPSSSHLDQEAYDAYKSTFGRALRVSDRQLSPEEAKAMSVGTDSDGGYLVPADDSGRIVRKIYETSDFRSICNVTTISTDKLEGVEDLDEAGAGWVGETAARPDTTTPEVGKYSIETFEMYAQPKTTQKLLDDAAVDVEAWLSGKVSDRFARLENASFAVGNGVGKPKGFASYATATDTGSGVTWGKIGFVKSGASGAFASADPADKVFDLIGLVKNQYLAGSRFVTKRAVITAMRKFKSDDGHYLWQPSLVLGNPETFAGYPITRAEDIPDLGASSLSLWFGNFAEAYQIVDRIGERVLRDPYTDKPYIRFYTTRRVGGGVVNFEAIKCMKFAS